MRSSTAFLESPSLLSLSFFLLLSVLPSFSDESFCPRGWTPLGDACGRAFLRPAKHEEAMESCSGLGARLPPPRTHEEVAELLAGQRESGLREGVWHVAGDRDEEAFSLQRQNNGSFSLGDLAGAPRVLPEETRDFYFSEESRNDFVALPCRVTGSPPPSVRWFRNDVQLVDVNAANSSLVVAGGSLLLPASSDLAYSTFHCEASNLLGVSRGPTLTLRPSFLDPFRSSRLDSFPLREGGARLSCDAPLHQPKSFAFSWLVHGSTEKFLVQSERVFVSLDGSLLFSHVLKEDDTTLAQSSRRSGHYGPFFRLRVPPQPPRPFSPRLASSFPQLFPEQPLTRSTLYIECFAFGFPQPSYEWHRMDGRRFSSRTTVTNFGRVLRIDKATDDDAGRYKCVASNELGRVEGEVAVVLRARPSIVQPLVDTARASGEDLELVCPLATGDASSAVEWFRNGRPIVPILMPPPLRARFSITHNSLRVRALEKKDSGVFECVASNDVGSSSSSALVWVVDEPPSFRPHTMPSRVFAIRGSSLSLACVYVASPTGAVAWADVSGARLPTKGRRRVEGDSLVIDDVQMEDAGVFFCTAENRLGKAHHSLKLVVIEKARVVVSPGKTSGDEAVNLTCEVEVNCENTVDCPEPLFGWNFNDRPLNLLPLKRNIKTKVHEQEKRSPSGSPLVSQSIDLEVPSSLGHKRIGRFSCTSLYGGGAADFEPRPGTPPVAVKAQNVTSHSLQLAWRAPPQHRELRHNSASGESYRVEMRTRKDRRWRALPKEVTHQGDVDSFVLTGLHPNNHYQFRVRVRTEAGLSEASSSAWVQTPPAAPSKPVENLRWTAVDGNSLLLEWDPVAEMDAGSRVKYRVSWSDKPNDELPNSFVSLLPSALLRVNSSESCRMIVIAVRPENDEGQGPLSSDTVAYLSSSGELKEAKEVKAETVNSTHANVSWVWEGAGECDAAYGVQISCTSDNSSVAAAVPAEYTHWLLGGLNPSSTYDCGLRAFDSRRRFGKTTAFTLLTPRGPPSERPQIRSLALKTSSHESGYTTLIEWSPVSFDDLVNASDLNFGYKIFIYLSETSKEPIVLEMPANKLVDPHMPMATVSGLKLMHLYRMQVAAYNVGGTGPPSALRSLRLGSGGQVLESTSCRARLWWLPLLFLFLLLVLH